MKKFLILLAVIFMDLLGGAEIDIFIPSFNEIKALYNLSTFQIEALLSVNFLSFCLSLFFVGSLADKYGAKKVISYSLVIFIIGSFFCTSSVSFSQLILGRFLQGIGIAAPASLCFVIVSDLYSLKQQQYIMAILNGLINFAIAGAPVVGGYITLYFGWKGNFTFLLIGGIITLLMTLFFIPSFEYKKAREEKISILKNYNLILLITLFVSFHVPYWLFQGISSILYIEDLKLTIKEYGLYQGSGALVFALGSLISGPIIKKFNQIKLLYISGLFCLFSFALIAFSSYIDTRNAPLIAVSLLLFAIGSVIPWSILFPVALNIAPGIKGQVSSIIQILRLSLTALFLEIAGYFYVGTFRNIGIMLCFLISITIITLYLTVKEPSITRILNTQQE